MKRRASSFARSRTSPTSRESRSVSAATMSSEMVARLRVLDEPLPERGDVAANRGQRRAQLVRHRHQEVPLELLGLAQPSRHLPEALREVADLASARHRGHLDLVVAARDLVGNAREVEHRPCQPPREISRQAQRDDEAAEERERQPPEQRHDARRELVLRLRDDECAPGRRAPPLPRFSGWATASHVLSESGALSSNCSVRPPATAPKSIAFFGSRRS